MKRQASILRLKEVDSTNNFLRQQAHADPSQMLVAVADYQTAGRGQGTNRWESALEMNVLMSILVHPKGIAAHDQFVLSMAGALAVRDALSTFADGFSVKWPNDIYHADGKVSGTLIETTLTGRDIRDCIFGVGINVNQQRFQSDAPNPVSICHIVGHSVSREEVVGRTIQAFDAYLSMAEDGQGEEISRRYHAHLYRRTGLHRYADAAGEFLAKTIGVEPDGHLILRDEDGHDRRYAFKEVKYIIK